MKSGQCFRCKKETERYSQHNKRWWCGCLPNDEPASELLKKIRSGRWLPLLKEHEGETLFVAIYRKSRPSDILYLPHAVVVTDKDGKQESER